MGLDGPGIEDKGVYRPLALRGWKNAVETDDRGHRIIQWEYRPHRGGPVERVLYEDRIGDVEVKLLMASPDVADRVLGTNRQRRLQR